MELEIKGTTHEGEDVVVNNMDVKILSIETCGDWELFDNSLIDSCVKRVNYGGPTNNGSLSIRVSSRLDETFASIIEMNIMNENTLLALSEMFRKHYEKYKSLKEKNEENKS
jgi:hypothetical protein